MWQRTTNGVCVLCLCMCIHFIWDRDKILGTHARTSMALWIPFLRCSRHSSNSITVAPAVVQITPVSSAHCHYLEGNWILEKPRGCVCPPNLLLICLWLVWPEPFTEGALRCPQALPIQGEARTQERSKLAFPCRDAHLFHRAVDNMASFPPPLCSFHLLLPSIRTVTQYMIHRSDLHPVIICLTDLESQFE